MLQGYVNSQKLTRLNYLVKFFDEVVLFLFCISYQGYYNALVATKLAFRRRYLWKKEDVLPYFQKTWKHQNHIL
jgi:hypothetical protein